MPGLDQQRPTRYPVSSSTVMTDRQSSSSVQRLVNSDVDTAVVAESDGNTAQQMPSASVNGGRSDDGRQEKERNLPSQVLHEVGGPSRFDLRPRVQGDHAEGLAARGQSALDACGCIFDYQTPRWVATDELRAEQVGVGATGLRVYGSM